VIGELELAAPKLQLLNPNTRMGSPVLRFFDAATQLTVASDSSCPNHLSEWLIAANRGIACRIRTASRSQQRRAAAIRRNASRMLVIPKDLSSEVSNSDAASVTVTLV
jgi:hypothetical protein